MKKGFVIDYEVAGTLYLRSPNIVAVRLRAERIIREALKDLQEVSVYCEEYIEEPIDEAERYPRLKSA